MTGPKVMLVIETYELRGSGSDADPYRRIRTYHSIEGNWLGEDNDPCVPRPRQTERARFAAQGWNFETIEDACKELDALSGQARAEAALRIKAVHVIRWALGEVGEFPAAPDRIAGKPYRRYWWRTEMRERAGDLLPAPSSENDNG